MALRSLFPFSFFCSPLLKPRFALPNITGASLHSVCATRTAGSLAVYMLWKCEYISLLTLFFNQILIVIFIFVFYFFFPPFTAPMIRTILLCCRAVCKWALKSRYQKGELSHLSLIMAVYLPFEGVMVPLKKHWKWVLKKAISLHGIDNCRVFQKKNASFSQFHLF